MKTLVVWFSRTGITRGVAKRLATALSAQSCAITERGSRLGALGYLRSVWEAARGRDAAIDPPEADVRGAELVVIGTPIWAWHLSSPVRAFARRHRGDFRRVAFFCTMGGAGADAAFAELRELTGREPLATLALADREIDTPGGRARLAAFVAALRAAR